MSKPTFIQRLFDPLATNFHFQHMRKSAKMTSRISTAFIFLSIVLLVITELSFGDLLSMYLLLGAIGVFLIILTLNYYHFPNASSVILCTFLPVMVLGTTLLLKMKPVHTDLLYYDSRVLLLGFSALPGMVFSTREPAKLYSSILVGALCFLLFDPIHESLGLGYYQKGFTQTNYYHINVIAIVVFAAISASTVILKTIVVGEENKNALLLRDMENQNQELETQNEEILAQTEELVTKQEQLAVAYRLIEKQKQELESLVAIKSAHINQSNEELLKYNNELRQFSYTISHNLRGPVARLLGLSNLVEMESQGLSDGQRNMLQLVRNTSHELDGIIKDLTKIIDIRNDVYRVKEKVAFQSEWERVSKMLEGQMSPAMKIVTDFSSGPHIYTIRPLLNSVLYNLVSNAIKYRSPSRALQVKVTTQEFSDSVIIKVKDNGLGIDLKQFGNDVFGMYKRFHTHTTGKGLGLYLVKTQVETLGGKVEVKSSLDHGTEFIVTLKTPAEIEDQVCFDSRFVSIHYNAMTNILFINWLDEPGPEDYKTVVLKCFEILRTYSVPQWVADMRKRKKQEQAELSPAARAIMKEIAGTGLRTVACIYSSGSFDEPYLNDLKVKGKEFNVDIEFFTNRADAVQWTHENKPA